MTWLVDSHQFEDEVAQSAEKEDNNTNHAGLVFSTSEKGGGQQDNNGDWNRTDSQGELGIGSFCNDDDKLNNEAEKKEEIEFQESNVNL